MGTMGLVFCFLVKSLFFLLCSGILYFASRLARVFTILLMKVPSFLFATVLAWTCLLSSVLRDIRAGIGLDSIAGSWPELGDASDTGVEALIDVSRETEASDVSAESEAQKVQLDMVELN